MISKRIDCEPKNDNYKHLAMYAGKAHKEEKVLDAWYSGCQAETFDDAITEVMHTRRMNTRATGSKTYHLMISFQPEDEAKLSPEILQDIEQIFAKALGFEEHQRHVGVHKNTDNLHMHIAYNMIHPGTFCKHSPFRDFKIQDEVRREIEAKYGLSQDRGMQDGAPTRPNIRAKTMEAHSGEQSFSSYMLDQKEAILAGVKSVQSWQELHMLYAKVGAEYRLRGNGAIIKNMHSEHAIKASSLDRSLSKAALEKRLGKFIESNQIEQFGQVELSRYEKRPMNPGAAQTSLFEEYTNLMQVKKERWETLKTKETELALHFKQGRNVLSKQGLPKPQMRKLTALSYKLEAEQRKQFREQYQELQREYPYQNWTDYLRTKAHDGDEAALQMLRWKKVELESPPALQETSWEERMRAVNTNKRLDWGSKKVLAAVYRMKELATVMPELEGYKWRVDGKGVVLITLPSGGLVRDAGTGPTRFSIFDSKAAEVAQRLDEMKRRQKSLAYSTRGGITI